MHWKICFSGKVAERGGVLTEFLINRKSRKSEGCLSSFSTAMEARVKSFIYHNRPKRMTAVFCRNEQFDVGIFTTDYGCRQADGICQRQILSPLRFGRCKADVPRTSCTLGERLTSDAERQK